ncbi:hypothetical protein AVEN_82007-1 [Araneus ventricosus]|uniref:Uncharacterized protein n=1 Tax=Araneus ventricosus TaxID=182803 RepID=A0A4Y2MN98_ARAVE|nr:hypothetical protein AVEN_82007-1 [Araneus ventricosus]
MLLAKDRIPIKGHETCFPDLVLFDFFSFSVVKSALKGTRFETSDAVGELDQGGEYIEGDNIKIIKNKNVLKHLDDYLKWPEALLDAAENSYGAVLRSGRGVY